MSTSRPLTNEDFLIGIVISIFPYSRSKYCVGPGETNQKARMLAGKVWGQEVRAPLHPHMCQAWPPLWGAETGRIVVFCRLPAWLQSQSENCLEKITQKVAEPATLYLLLASTRTWVCAPAYTCAYTLHNFLSHTQNTTCFLFTFIVLVVTGQFSFSNHQWTSLGYEKWLPRKFFYFWI